MIAASLLIGGFYPLTQIYQHDADRKDGVLSISARLGYRGTFIFCAIIYSMAMGVLGFYYMEMHQFPKFIMLTTMLLPVLIFFLKWAKSVWRDVSAANFNNTMRLNVVASICTSIAFIILIIWNRIE
jgi:1,4-dihydroxy-2-naphthoate octaprenyltransferase